MGYPAADDFAVSGLRGSLATELLCAFRPRRAALGFREPTADGERKARQDVTAVQGVIFVEQD